MPEKSPSQRFINEATMPRLHLIGTLCLILAVTLALATFYSWRNERLQRNSLAHITQVMTAQQHARLTAEMQSAVNFLEFLRQRTEEVLRRNIVEQVDAAVQMAQAIHTREAGRIPPEQVKQLIVEALRPVRFFNGRGYIFIDTMQGDFVLLPIAPEYEGRAGIDNRDDSGAYIMRGLINAASLPEGGGFFHYRWYHPNTPGRMAQKVAYVRRFVPYDWLIGTGDYLLEWEEQQKSEAMQRLRALRFGATGTVGLIDIQGRSLLSPNDLSIEGMLPEQMPEIQRRALQKLRAKAQEGGGFVEYDWPRPGAQSGAPLGRKTALVSTYAPWGWVLVTSIFNDELEAALAAEKQAHAQDASQQRLELALVVLGSLALGMLGSLVFSRWSRRLFARYHRQLQRAQENLRIAAIAFESQEGILVTDAQGVILRVNRAFTRITGYSAEEAVGQTPKLLKSGRHGPDFYTSMHTSLATAGMWSGEIWNRRKDGVIFPEWLTITAVRDEGGQVTHYVSTLTDITQRKEAEAEIRHLAFHDLLTGLPNRRLLIDRLQHALLSSRRTCCHGALMFIDLDNFKLVNDSMGHEQGDVLLQEMGQRLVAAVREGDTVARLGGDEFVVVLEGLDAQALNAAAEAEAQAKKILNALARPVVLAGQELQCTGSIGVVLFMGLQVGVQDLMQRADLAMYQAKDDGRNTVRFFDPQMQASVMQRIALEKELRTALQDNQLRLFHQPQVDLQGRMVGTEGLLRWQHPQRGVVGPGEFIALAEDTGLILPLGQWVLQAACEQLAQWRDDPRYQHLTVSINVSGRQLQQEDFVDQVRDVLQRTGAPPERLKLELTESLLLDNPQDAVRKMAALQALGVRFALDDFGTGYSSLAYLRQLPLSQLKIDRSFVHDLGSRDLRATAIVRTVVTMANNLGLDVIAEGVETSVQREELARNGCYAYQGYLFGQPVPVEQLCAAEELKT